jgi:hypothetical protein
MTQYSLALVLVLYLISRNHAREGMVKVLTTVTDKTLIVESSFAIRFDMWYNSAVRTSQYFTIVAHTTADRHS